MHLRPIPFIEDARYRIAQDGTVWAFELPKPGRKATPRYAPLLPMTLGQATDAARKYLANSYFPLIDPDDGVVHHVLHRESAAPDEARLVGGEFAPAGDTRSGWYSIRAVDGTMHLFHGPSVASVAFRRNQ